MGTVKTTHKHTTHTTMFTFFLLLSASVAEAFVASPPIGQTRATQSKVSINMASTQPLLKDFLADHGADLSIDDIAWDPLNLATEDNLAEYREAELKHGRLAMLATAGYLASEAWEPIFAKILGVKDELIETAGRAPSLLNGGLEENQIPWFLLTVGIGASFAEVFSKQIKQANPGMYEAGNMGFAPLGLYPADKVEQDRYKLAELKHGRVAMIAIALIVLEEAISGTSFLKESPVLFNEIGRIGVEGPTAAFADIETDLIKDAAKLAADVVKEVDFYEAAISPTAAPLF